MCLGKVLRQSRSGGSRADTTHAFTETTNAYEGQKVRWKSFFVFDLKREIKKGQMQKVFSENTGQRERRTNFLLPIPPPHTQKTHPKTK